MEFIVTQTPAQATDKAYEIIAEAVNNKIKVLGLATGSTPEPLYEKLIASDLDFSDITTVNLDEYVGLAGDHPQSYQYYMNEKLFKHKNFKANYLPNGLNDEAEEVARYNQILAENPVDLQILGLGQNGHIAFNEPGTPLDSETHKVELTESTIQANKRFFRDEADVPRFAYTMGLASIMKAKKIILLAFGESKAQAIKDLVTAEVADPAIPSTVLVDHPDVTVIVDEAAASLLEK